MKLPTHHFLYKYFALLAGILALVRAGSVVRTFNHTTDELSHIASAVGLYESGKTLYMVEHPPLQRLWVGWALEAAGVEYAPARGLKTVQERSQANVAGAQILYEGKVPYWNVLTVARLANLVFAAPFLIYVYMLGRYFANPLMAMLASVFVSVDANFLAHASLCTTDIPAAAGFLCATYHGIRFVAHPRFGRAIVMGITLGLAMSCKFTCVLLVPSLLVIIAFRMARAGIRSKKGRSAWRAVRRKMPPLRHIALIAFLAFVTLWGTYFFAIGKLAEQELFDQQRAWKAISPTIKNASIPMPSMVLGIMFMAALGKFGFPVYLNGDIDLQGKWYYFPEALALKSPIGFLMAFALAILFFTFLRRRKPGISSIILILPLFLLLAAMLGKLQIGIRHILPVIPFLYLFAALHLHRQWRIVILLPLIAVAALETAVIHPDYLAFFNRIKGGAEHADQYLADSNLDWGQDVARLATYLKENKKTDYTIKVSGARVEGLLQTLGLNPDSTARDPEYLQSNPHGLLCISTNARLGLEGAKRLESGELAYGEDFDWAQDFPLVARIGKSIYIYNLDARPGKK